MMMHWKRILAAVGATALLASNLGSVTQTVFAGEDYTEGTPAGGSEESSHTEESTDDSELLSVLSIGEVPDDAGDNDEPSGDDDTKDIPDDSGENKDIPADGEGDGDSEDSDEPGDPSDENLPDHTQPANGEQQGANGENQGTEGGTTENNGSQAALSDTLTISLDTTESKKHDPAKADDGAYLYNLGETASTTITLTNPEDHALAETDGAVVRVYMQFTDSAADAETEDQQNADSADSEENTDAKQSDDTAQSGGTAARTKAAGTYTVETDDAAQEDHYQYVVTEIGDGLYCYAFERPIVGDSYQVEMTSVYGSDTAGGENQIWTVVMTAAEAEAQDVKASSTSDGDNKTVLRWEKAQADTNTGDIQVQTAQTENYMVSVAYGPEAQIPEDAELKVVEYDEFSEEYQKAVEESGRALGWLLDVSFYVDDEEIEPANYVGISVAQLRPFDDNANYEDWDDEDVEQIAEETSRKARALLKNNNAAVAVASDDADADEPAAETSIIHFAESGVESVSSLEQEDDSAAVTFAVDSLSLLAQDYGAAVDNTADESDIMLAAATQPTYSSSGTTSDAREESAITGTIDGIDDADIAAASDKATSRIEDQFTGTSDQDGKILTDKSVVYGKDDYGAFGSYDADTFSVTMSALGQEYEKEVSDKYTVPVDVVFVLDVSGSMKESATGSGNTSRREAMVDAVNNVMHSLLDGDENKNNRVGIAIFSSGSSQLLALDHYTAGYNSNFIYLNNGNVLTARNLRNGNGGTVTQTSGNITQATGTFTQSGIARGAEIFNNSGSTTCEVTTESGKTITVNRQPVYILISDGEPTHCTDGYDDVFNSDAYGSGNADSNENNKGVLGYYTILSANYYKQQVSTRYGQDATFYSVGWGIRNEGGSNYNGDTSASSAYYKRAVLDPSSGNVSALENDSTNNINTDVTSKQLFQLLNNTYQYNSVSVKKKGDAGDVGTTYHSWSNSNNVPVVSNPYKDSGYAYANGSKFGNFSASDLKDYIDTAIKESRTPKEYSFGLLESTGITLTDPIGDGMEIKGAPVLNYGGQNYTVTSTSGPVTDSDGSKTTTYVYGYSKTYKELYPENYNSSNGTPNTGDHHKASDSLDMSQIKVTVTTDTSGKQTVQMVVPANLMPVYYPDDTKTFYYHETPIRLVYQVGLTDAAKKAANEQAEGASLSYYVNQWQSGENASGQFSLDSENPYGYTDANGNKDLNASDTSGTYFTESKSNSVVTQNLGNNGKLTISKKKKELVVQKVWKDTNDNVIEDTSGLPEIKGTLHRNYIEETTGIQVTLRYSYRKYLTAWRWNSSWADPLVVTTITVAPNSSFSFYYTDENGGRQNLYYAPEVSSGNGTTATYGTVDGYNVVNVNVGSSGPVVISVGTDTIYDYNVTPSSRVVYTTSYEPPGTGQVREDSSFSKSITLNNANGWTNYWTASDLNERSDRTYSYWVTEDAVPEGYTSTIDFGSSDQSLDPVEGNKTITITNRKNPSYVLPSTGGFGTLPLEVGGSAALLGSMVVGYSRRRRDGKEGE